jgi:hypothetical protein
MSGFILNSTARVTREEGTTIALINGLKLRRSGDFKLLKLLILRVIWRLLKLYHTGEVFETLSSALNRLGKLDHYRCI